MAEYTRKRQVTRHLFSTLFEECGGLDGSESQKWGHNLEKHVHNWTIEECRKNRIVPCPENTKVKGIYDTKRKALLCNLDHRRGHVRNETLMEKVVNREIPLYDLVYTCTHREYMPERYLEYDAALQKEEEIARAAKQEEIPDGMLKCRRCKSMKTSYVMVQTRSADEPSTLKVQCQICGLRWSQSA